MRTGVDLIDYWGDERPKNRSECVGGVRPCPFVSCRYHLYLDVKPHKTSETIMINYAELGGPHEMEFSCALDEIEKYPGGMTLEQIGKRMNITRERVRQIEASLRQKLVYQNSPNVQALLEIWGVVVEHRHQQLEAMDDHSLAFG